MIFIRNKQRRFLLDLERMNDHLKLLLESLNYGDFDIGILITTNKTIQQYNREYREKDKPTDVLSFPFYPEQKPGKRIKVVSDDEKNLGDIIISPEYIWNQFADFADWEEKTKKEQAAALADRIDVLLVHGLCHLLGYDHLADAQYRSMYRKELQLLKLLRTK